MSAAEIRPLTLNRAEYARLLHQVALEIRDLQACVSPGYRTGVAKLADKVDYLATSANSVSWSLPGLQPPEPKAPEKETPEPTPQPRRQQPDYQRNTRSRQKNPAPGLRRCSRCEDLLPLDMFTVTDTKTGKRRADCKACYNEHQRQRYVRAGCKIVTIEVLDGDACVGHPCAICGQPFKVGQHIQGEHLHHEGCAPEAAP